MSITSLYRDYFQKSRVFLYPALGIRRGVSVTPVQTYTSWNGVYTEGDMKLCVLYHLREDQDFKLFEENKLLNHPLFHDFKKVGDGDGIYVFDYETHKDDWGHFLNGKYSKLSESLKKAIRGYYGPSSPNFPYIDSFLSPERYFRMYADLMSVDERILHEVGELCSLPDLDQETLRISIKDLEVTRQSS